jgi:RHS repeat-associated protein
MKTTNRFPISFRFFAVLVAFLPLVGWAQTSSPPSAPVFAPVAGTYTSVQTVTITSAGATSIYYTTDGSTPTTSSTAYSSPITVSATTTLGAIGVNTGGPSPVTSVTYTINIPPPVITVQPQITSFSQLHSFSGGNDGSDSYGGLIQGTDGRLYGTTNGGGSNGSGTVFAVYPDGTGFSTLYNFSTSYNNNDGGRPRGALVQGTDGRLYGTTSSGGTKGDGTIFGLNPDGTGYSTLYNFTGVADGANPYAGLVQANGQLYGTTYNGGANGDGTIFTIKTNGTGYSTLYSFTGGPDGTNPYAGLAQGTDGRLYGTASGGGANGFGDVFAINADGTSFVTLYSFSGQNDGGFPVAGLSEGAGGQLYGTSLGGANGNGTVFSVHTDGTKFATIYSFAGGNDGSDPYAGLVQGIDGQLYGTTYDGGANKKGTIFSVHTDGTAFTTLYSFSGYGDGAFPQDKLIQGTDGRFYGTTFLGGSSNVGSVYAVSSQTTIAGTNAVLTVDATGSGPLSYQWQFNGVNISGATSATLTLSNVGASNAGSYTVVVSNPGGSVTGTAATLTVTLPPPPAAPVFSPAAGNYTSAQSVTITSTHATSIYYTTDGSQPTTSSSYYSGPIPITATTTFNAIGVNLGGSSPVASGTYNVNIPLPTITVQPQIAALTPIYTFTGINDGSIPAGKLIQGTDGRLYGTTNGGGLNGFGTVFAVNSDGTGFTTLHTFTGGNDGANPAAGLVQAANGLLYGTTSKGGANNFGTIFSLNTNGTGYATLYAFINGTDGANPESGLIQGIDLRLYGTANSGGANNSGTVFAFDPTGNYFATLYTFTNSNDGAFPQAGVIQGTDHRLYGVATFGGVDGKGSLFALATDGTGFVTLYNFTGGADGSNPATDLIQGVDGRLYGTTYDGGVSAATYNSGAGAIFAINTNGTGFTTIHSFTRNDDYDPRAGLVQGTDGRLYGTAHSGGTNQSYGSSNDGTVFALNTDGTGYTSLYTFTNGDDGGSPQAGLVQGSDGRLYGTTSSGGLNSNGTLFAISNQTTFAGDNVSIAVAATGTAPLSYDWQFNGQNLGAPNSATLSLTNVNASNVGSYDVIISLPGGSITSNVVTFTVNTPPAPSTPVFTPAGGTYTSAPSVTISSAGATAIYYTTDGSTPTTFSSSYSGPISISTTTTLNAIGVNAGGSSPVATAIYTINIPPPALPTITAQPQITSYSLFHTFTAGSDGDKPQAGLIQGVDGRLYGTAGPVFAVNTDGTGFTTVYSFTGGNAGSGAALIQGAGGRLYGTTGDGGANGDGTVFAMNANGTGFTTLYSFADGTDGAFPNGLILGTDGQLYGTTAQGGTHNNGTVFVIKTDGTGYTTLYRFSGENDGAQPNASLIQGTDGRLYGTTYSGGSSNEGTVFAIKTNGKGFSALYNFTGGTDGGQTSAGVIQGSDGHLYGTTPNGGVNDDGNVFAMNTDGTGFITLYSFTGATDGDNPNGVIEGAGGRLYGTAVGGGTNGSGTVFAVNTDGTGFTTLYNCTGGDDGSPNGGLIQGTGGQLYGTTSGEDDYEGTVFALSNQTAVAGTNVTITMAAAGTAPLTYQWQFNGANIIGATSASLTLNNVNASNVGSYTVVVSNSAGSVTSAAATLTVTVPPPPTAAPVFFPATGTYTSAQSVTITSAGADTIYYTTDGSPPTTSSAVYSGPIPVSSTTTINAIGANPGGSGPVTTGTYTINLPPPPPPTPPVITAQPQIASFSPLYTFTGGNDGSHPEGSLIQGTDGRLYGTVSYSGNGYYGGGGVFAINADGTNFITLHTFTGGDGANPQAGLIEGNDGRLYGTTTYGGINNTGYNYYNNGNGTIFAINRDGTGFTTLYIFTGGNDGYNPEAGLIEGSDGRLYGTASQGGINGNGTVFAINKDGTGFTTLHSFNGTGDGGAPYAGLVQGADGRLYGAANSGGTNGNGTIFTIETNGTGYATLHNLSGPADGSNPQATLIQGSDLRLYGTTQNGGANNNGTVFAVKTTGAGFATLYTFNGGNNYAVYKNGLIQGTDGRLYETTPNGGANGDGTVFAMNTDGTGFTPLYSFTGSSDGIFPDGSLIQGIDGRLFGTADNGGANGDGTVFEVSSQNAIKGANTTITVAATGTAPLAYQWQFNGVDIAGATSATLTLANVNSSNVGSYTVVVSNSVSSVTSMPVPLALILPPLPFAPVFSPGAGTYTSAQSVTITSAGATQIYYTTDGSTPTIASTLYSGPVPVAQNTVLQAIGVNTVGASPVASANYTLLLLPAPVFSLAPGTYSNVTSPLFVTISDTANGATIYYTTDGSMPTTASTRYTAAVSLPIGTTTLSAIATNSSLSSSVATGVYKLIPPLPATPTFNPPSGAYTGPQSVAITSDKAMSIYYTTDGTIPTASSNFYTGAVTINSNTVLQAIGVNNSGASPTASASYTIIPSAPLFNPVPGTYNNGTTLPVAISDAVSGSSIYYTTDGSTPTASSTPYTVAVSLPVGTTMLSAVAVNANGSSAITTGTYVLTPPSPVFSPAPGLYNNSIAVTLSPLPASAAIDYTTDGSTPTTSSTAYTGPIAVSATTHIKAIDSMNGQSSSVADGTFNIGLLPTPPVPTSGFAGTYYQDPDFSGSSFVRLDPVVNFPANGNTIPAGTASALWTATLTAQFNDTYTFYIASDGNPQLWIGNTLVIDGASQTGYQKLSGTISLVQGQAYPVRLQYLVRNPANAAQERLALTWSSAANFAEESIPIWQVASGLTYANTVSAPTASPAGGTVSDGTAITLSTSAPTNADIYYTVDGSVPTTSSALYTSPIVLHSGVTLKAMGTAANYNNSGILVATYTIDRVGPTLSPVTFNGGAIPGLITASGILGITATSDVGIQSVTFSLDGQVIGADTASVNGIFTAPLNLNTVSDGTHQLSVQAVDNLGIASTPVTVTLNTQLAPPPAPILTSPQTGTIVNISAVTLRGTAQAGSNVTIYSGAAVIGSVTAGADGSFAINVTLAVGANSIDANATNRNPQPSAFSNSIAITYNASVPSPPAALSAQSGPNGVIRLAWQPPLGGGVSGYYLFRSTSAIPDNFTVNTANAIGGLLEGQVYTDTPPADGHYYYRMVTVYGTAAGQNFSSLSNQADAVADSVLPIATVALQPLGNLFDATHHLLGRGLVQATLTTNKPLGATPFLNFSIAGAGAIAVDLTATNGTTYTGILNISANTPSGALTPIFSGVDAAGNRGSVVTMPFPWTIATAGPIATGLTPVQISSSGVVTPLPVFDVIQNVPVPPATAVTVSWELTLNEPPATGLAPNCTATLAGTNLSSVTVANTSDGNPLTWLITVTLPSTAGAGQGENLTLGYSVNDDLGNYGSTIVPPHVFQVYQSQLPPFDDTQLTLTATAQPAGAVSLNWTAIPGASSYELQVEGPTQSAFQDLTQPNGSATNYVYTTATDGFYSYRIASVRSDNGQNSTGGWSNVATATSARIPPNAPTNLSLQVIGQGVQASWAPPVNNFSDVAGYALYRSANPISSIASLTPVVANIPASATSAIDPNPDGSIPNYALVSFDAAGNASAIVAGNIDVSLLPPGTIKIAETDQQAPVLTWQAAPNSTLSGYNLLIDNTLVPVNGATLIPFSPSPYTYIDSNYQSGDRTYTVTSLGNNPNGTSSVSRSLVLPNVSISLDPKATIIRGLVNTVNMIVQNLSKTDTVTDANLTLVVAGADGGQSASDLVTLAPGAQQTVPVVVGGFPNLPAGSTPVSATLTIMPNDGEQVTLTRSLSAPVTDGAFMAQITPTNMVSGGNGSVTFTLTNPSDQPIEFKVAENNGAQPSSEARIQVLDQQDNLLSTTPLQLVTGNGVILMPDGTSVVQIPPKATYTSPPIVVPVPLNAPATVNVALGVDSVYYNYGDLLTQIQLPGPSVVTQASTQVAPYSATITSITPSVSNGTAPIVIQGSASWQGANLAVPSAPATGVPLNLFIKNGDFVQQAIVTTDANGNFSYTYQPGAAELGGNYLVWASHPSVTAQPANPGTFTINSVVVTKQSFTLVAPRNYKQTIQIPITTGPGTTATNLRAVLVGSPPEAISVPAVTPIDVGGSQTTNFTLPLYIVGLTPPDNNALDQGVLTFNIVSDGAPGSPPQTWATIQVIYTFSPASPHLTGTPSELQIGVQYGGIIGSGTINLSNTGLAALDTATFSLVSQDGVTPVPSWIQLGSPATLSSLDIGGNFSAIVTVNPPASANQTTVQFYDLNLHVHSDNDTQDFPVVVAVSPFGNGGVSFKVVDPYYQFTFADGTPNPSINGVPGAVVTLQNVTSNGIPTTTLSATTGSDGMVYFGTAITDIHDPNYNMPLLAGSYQVFINVDKHEPYAGNVTIQPGINYSQQILLTYAPISFNWSVVPVTFQDKYNIVLTATYETHVPVPVVVMQPASITLPPMCSGQTLTGQIKATNYGLVAAQQVQITPPPNDANFSYEISSNFGDTIPAGQTVILTYKVTCLQPLPEQCPAVSASGNGGGAGGSGGCGSYATPVHLGFIFPCINSDTFSSGSAQSDFAYGPWGNCPVPPSIGSLPVLNILLPPGVPIPPLNGHHYDTCFPPPSPGCPPPGPTPNPQPCQGNNGGPPPCDNNHFQPVGSWVDMTSREFYDAVTDLSVPVPNGSISAWRDFRFDQWTFRTDDDFYALTDNAQIPHVCALVINGEYYLDPSSSFDLTEGSTIGQPQYVEGETFLELGGKSPGKIQASNGYFVWTDGQGNERDYDPTTAHQVSTKFRGQLVANYNYDSSGRLATVTDSTNRTIFTFAYTGSNVNPDSVTDLTGRQVSYAYYPSGQLYTVTDAVGTIMTYIYDNSSNLTSKSTHIANTSPSQDDAETISYADEPAISTLPPARVVPGSPYFSDVNRGQVIEVKHNATGWDMTFDYQYNSEYQTYYVKTTTSEGVVTEFTFDQNSNLLSKLVNGQQVYQMQQDATTRVVTRGAEQTTEQYDANGYVVSRIYPDNTSETYEYDPTVNRVSSYTNRLGVVTTYTYDALGNELTRTEAVGTPLERVTKKDYVPGTTLLKTVTDPLGHQTSYDYDPENNLRLEYDPANLAHQTQYHDNAIGQMLTKTDALGNVTTYAYNAAGQLASETDPLQEQTLYTYQGALLVQVETGRTQNASGQIIPGRIMRYGYDAQGRRTMEKRVDAQGNETVFKTYAYDNDGRLVSATNALGQSTTYGYDAAGNQNTIGQPDDTGGISSTQTIYDALGRDTGTIDPLDVATQKTYDLLDRVVNQTEAVGTPVQRSTSYTYDALGNVLTEQYTDVINPSRTYTTIYAYDALGHRTSTGGDHNYAITDSYDADDQLKSQTDARNNQTTYDYDNYGHVMDTKLNGTTIESDAFDLIGNQISKTDGAGNHTHFYYDALNRLAATSIPLSATQAMPNNWWTQPAYVRQATAYDAWSEVASTTRYTVNGSTVQSAVTTYIYDSFGRKMSEKQSGSQTDGSTTVNNEPLTVNFSYNAADNLLTTTYPPVASSGAILSTTESYSRSPYNDSLVDAFEDRSDLVTSYVYNEALRQKEFTTSLGAVTGYTYDALGRVATQTDPAGTTSYQYDLFDHQTQITFPDDAPGNPRVATFTYDNFGNLVTQAGAGDYPVSYGYDAVGNRNSMTDSNQHQTQWLYNARNQVQTKTCADGTTYNFTYDGAGNLRTRQDALGHTATYSYNAYNLLASITYPTDPPVAFTYDQQGNRTSMSDGSGTTTWTYDSLGRMSSETQSRSQRTLTYNYDNFGNRISMLVQPSTLSSQPSTTNWTTIYGYDNAGRMQSILDSRLPAGKPFVYAYKSNANLVSTITTPTGLTENKSYDTLGRLTSISALDSGRSTLDSFAYTYNAASQRTTETTSDYQQNFAYDPQRELTQATPINPTPQRPAYQYAYDGIGNRQTVGRVIPNAPSDATAYATNNLNQYTAITETLNSQPTTVNPVYDANGNTTSLSGLTLVYDEENRLVKVSNATTQEAYTYDGLGRRVETQVATVDPTSGLWNLTSDTRFVYDGRCVVEEWSSSPSALQSFSLSRSYTRGLDLSGSLEGDGGIGGILALAQPVVGSSNLSAFTAASYFYNGNGDVIDLVGDDGSSQAHYQYSPFGERLSATGTLTDINSYQFSTKEHDAFTDFYYYGLRYYDPATGRWLSRDPIDENGGANLYGFAANDAIDNIDVFGEDFITVGTRTALPGIAGDITTEFDWASHYSIEYYSVCNNNDIHELEEFSPENPPKGAIKMHAFQLLPADRSNPPTYSRYVWRSNGRSRHLDREIVGISFIYTTSTPHIETIIYVNSDANQKWQQIVAASAQYKYAEHSSPGAALHYWPNSKYGYLIRVGAGPIQYQAPLGTTNTQNNSNTYIRELARSIGRNADVAPGGENGHPGNEFPIPVQDNGPVPTPDN